LLAIAALPAWAVGGACTESAAEPQSVGERFNWNNRPDSLTLEGWEVRPSVSAGAGYDDNITLRRGDGPSSSELSLGSVVEANRNLGPYVLDLNAFVRQFWYPDSPDNEWTEVNVRAAARFDSNMVAIHGAASFLQGAERSIDNGIFVDGAFDSYSKRAEYRRVPLEAGIEYDISHFKLASDLRIVAVDYEEQTTASNLSVSQDFRSGWEGAFRLRGGYETHPGLSFFAETAATTGRYRDSQGDRDAWRIVGGAEFEFSRLLLGEVSAGYTQLSLIDDAQTSGFSYRAGLHWFVNELVSLSLSGERSIDGEVATTSGGVTSVAAVTNDTIKLRAEWEPLLRLFVYAQSGYEERVRASNGQTDAFTSFGWGAAYVLTSSLKLTVDGSHEFGTFDYSSDIERHRVSVGLTAAF
jgi:hypothetical protein